eukprot:5525997-Prymnesium_polylepis.1
MAPHPALVSRILRGAFHHGVYACGESGGRRRPRPPCALVGALSAYGSGAPLCTVTQRRAHVAWGIKRANRRDGLRARHHRTCD